MVGGGEPKDVTFAVDNISAVDGKLVVRLKLYKGTNNNGCFYGLTKIMMDVEKGGTDEPEPDPAPLGTATFQLSPHPLTANELNAKTEPTYIAIKNLSSGNHDWLFANANEANYSRDFSNDAVYIWQPVQGESGKFYLKRTDGTYMQTTSPKDFGAIAGAAKFAATHPQRAQNSYYDDAEPYIDIEQDEDPCLVRFVNQDNKWINCQWPNSAPIYNTGNGSWTIHYAYEAKKVEGFKVNIDETKYSTMFTTYNIDLSEVDGISAYYIQEGAFHDGSVKLTPIEHDVLPALTAVILYAEVAGEYTLPYTTKTGASVEGNLLEGNFVDSYIIHEGYILSNSNMGVGLYKAAMNKRNGTAFLNNGGKAYLPVSAVPPAQQVQGFKFDEFTSTAIDGVATGNTGDKVVYDLGGRRINGITTAGVYIINGKKIMVK
jgi:hypothetical protein